ncbi:MAG: DNA polymerase/3'-5' exonuclease PolX [Archaeoglobaceae archaeon]
MLYGNREQDLMKNQEIARVLYEIGDYLEMEGVQFKPRAYRKAAQNIESLSVDIEDLYRKGELENISGVGKSIAKKIEEYLETGKVKKLQELKEKAPVDTESLMNVEGLGPKTIEILYSELGIKNLDDLERAAKEGQIRRLKGFGRKTEEKILENISLARRKSSRYLLGHVLPQANQIVAQLRDQVDKIEIAGSLRRKKETIGDIDILAVSSTPERVMRTFTHMSNVAKVIEKGVQSSSVRLDSGIQVDLRVVENKSFGSALQYFTGSKDHNIALRKVSIRKGYKLNEYGLFKGDNWVSGETEEEVYETLGLQWIPPEMRENRGEINAALEGNLPRIVGYSDLKGDLQTHTTWSDGAHSVEEMVEEARRLGHEYIAITDHVGSLKIAGGMEREEILEQREEIERVREKYSDIHVLQGCEANIMKDGSLDVSKELLEELDLVLASIHSSFRMSEKDMTNRVIKALENEEVNILAHPTCRKIHKREPININLEKLMEAARENNVVLEINADPERLDLKDTNVKRAVDQGVNLSIGTDAHTRNSLQYYELGVAVARRGWAKKEDIINTYSVKELLKTLKK